MPEKIVDLVPGTPVHAADGPVGRLERIIIDPEHDRTTALVIREAQLPNTLRLVSEKYLERADGQGVTLSLTRKRFEAQKPYIETDYYAPDFFLTVARQEQCTLPLSPASWIVERPATPAGAVALVGHETVEATDGKVGRVDGVLLDREGGHVTHIVLRHGHLWGARDILVPAGLVVGYEDGRVRLAADKAAIEALAADSQA